MGTLLTLCLFTLTPVSTKGAAVSKDTCPQNLGKYAEIRDLFVEGNE